jgi:predicted kinase
VVLDASFREHAQRDALRALAARRGVALRFVECWAPEDMILTRLAERAKGPSVSDGRQEVFDAFRRSYEALREGEGVRLDTSRDLTASLTELARA